MEDHFFCKLLLKVLATNKGPKLPVPNKVYGECGCPVTTGVLSTGTGDPWGITASLGED